jgi:oligo-1,6-glucosidase
VPERDRYYLHLFAKEQLDLNRENPVARKAIYETAIEY